MDNLEIEILDDGTVKISSPGSISGANHATADAAFKFIAAQLAGETKTEKLKERKTHVKREQQHRRNA